MKTLALFRHAKTNSDSPTGRDFDRQLVERGKRHAFRMGEEIRALQLRFDLLLCSPAVRAVQTAELAGLSPRFDEQIYDASAGELMAIIQQTPPDAQRLLMIGHNPGFEQIASLLAQEPIGMATGALAQLELPIDDWRNAGSCRGKLVRFLRPEELG